MNEISNRFVTCFLAATFVIGLVANCGHAQDSWLQLRGQNQGHAVVGATLPGTWSASENIVWKTKIEGLGWSSPVIDGDEIWLTNSIDKERSLRALCLSRKTGEIRIDVEVFNPAKLIAKHDRNSHATPTPVLDKENVYVHFGSYGTAALKRTTGKVLWKNQKTVINHQWGPGSSPILFQNLLVFNCDGMKLRYVVALDKATGKQVWKTDRSIEITKGDFFRKAFSTPSIAKVNNELTLLTGGANQISAFVPADGKEQWSAEYFGYAGVTTPVSDSGRTFVTSGYGDQSLMAIQLDDTADHKSGEIIWSTNRNAPIIPTPIVVGTELYMVSDNGILSCLDAATGKVHWKERLQGGFAASITFGDGKLFLPNDKGVTFVVSPSKESCEIIAKNRLDSNIQATPAIVDNEIFIRTKSSLYCIGKTDGRP